jgi:hypothetical protein
MTSTRARVLVGVLGAAAIVGLFFLLPGSDDDDSPTTTSAPQTTGGANGGNDEPNQPKKPPKPQVPTIVVRNGEPVGGVQELTFKAGEDIRFDVRSDAAAEVHFHGYDVSKDVQAGGEVGFDVPADIEGVFEVELEETVTQIAQISVEP